MTKAELTDRQQAVYDFLLAFLLEHHRQPTTREIGAYVGTAWNYYPGAPQRKAIAQNAVSLYLEALAKKGWLEWDRPKKNNGQHRHWKLVGVRLAAIKEEDYQAALQLHAVCNGQVSQGVIS